MSGPPESAYGVRRAADDIKKLRAKGMVSKIGKSRPYESVPEKMGCGHGLLCWSFARRSSGHYLPPAAHLSLHYNRSIPLPSTAIMKVSAPVCALSSTSWVWPPEDRQFSFSSFSIRI